MNKLDRVMAEAKALDSDSRRIIHDLVELYEDELSQMTSHLSQIYEELMLLYDLGGEITTTLDVGDLADRAHERLLELLNANRAVIVLAGGEEDRSTESHLVGSHTCPLTIRPLIGWATRRAMTEDRSLIINDLESVKAPPAPAVASLLSAPLRARGTIIGAVHVLDKYDAAGFTTEDQLLLETIAAQIGVVMENARLFHREQRHAQDLSAALDELEFTYDNTLAALSGALDLRDNETEGHARRVTQYSVRIAREMGFAGTDLVNIERGALMHDLGKIGVPDSILLKPSKLTDEEWEVMKTHPQLGYQMIRNISFLADAAPVVLHHHERYDGEGYPGRLRGEDIPVGARIFAVADTFDAMTSDRPYRKALPFEVAREELRNCAGSQFDPEVVAAFCKVTEAEWQAIRAAVEEQLAAKRRDEDPSIPLEQIA